MFVVAQLCERISGVLESQAGNKGNDCITSELLCDYGGKRLDSRDIGAIVLFVQLCEEIV